MCVSEDPRGRVGAVGVIFREKTILKIATTSQAWDQQEQANELCRKRDKELNHH